MPKPPTVDVAPAFVRALEHFHDPGVHRDFDVIGPLLRQARHELDALTDAAVREAVERGEPWSRIGPALGVSRQAAQQRCEALDDETAATAIAFAARARAFFPPTASPWKGPDRQRSLLRQSCLAR